MIVPDIVQMVTDGIQTQETIIDHGAKNNVTGEMIVGKMNGQKDVTGNLFLPKTENGWTDQEIVMIGKEKEV